MVRNYLSGPKWVQGTVLRRSGPMSYDVLVDSKVWKCHTDQIIETRLTPDFVVREQTAWGKDPEYADPLTITSPVSETATPDENNVNDRSASPNIASQPELISPRASVIPRRYPARERVAPKRLIEEV